MTRLNYQAPADRRPRTSTISSRLAVRNKTLESEYYRQRTEEAAQRKTRVDEKKQAKERRDRLIANDLRGMSVSSVMHKWRVGRSTIDRICGDMYIGKY